MLLVFVSLICGALALVTAAFMANFILHQDRGPKSMTDIADAIQEGAQAFLGREYKVLSIVIIVVAIILAVIPNIGPLSSTPR